jgi:hypothetical protein
MRFAAAAVVSFILAGLGIAGRGLAQDAPRATVEVERRFDSGVVRNTGPRAAAVISFPVQVEGARSLRLHFAAIEMPERGAFLQVTSVLDGAQQRLTAARCREWRNSTCYFNGGDVQVEVVADPGSGPCRVALDRVEVDAEQPSDSLVHCSIDDRVLSRDPRVGRTLPLFCTAFLIDDCRHGFLTAGHCVLDVVEFNVPISDAQGNAGHPPPEDQYAIDTNCSVSVNGGVGNDYAYSAFHPNPNTGLKPFQKQQACFRVAPSVPTIDPSITIRVTGCGTDPTPPERNFVRQTSLGGFVWQDPATLGFQNFIRPGNSGSPVIWEQQQTVLGIVTHLGCQTDGFNFGTSVDHGGIRAAIADPGALCPCTGEANTYCTGKVNSGGCTETIGFVGTPSFSGATPFHVVAEGIVADVTGILYYAPAPSQTPFSGGTLCLGGTLARMPAQGSGHAGSTPTCAGTFDFDVGAWIAQGADPELAVGSTRFAQILSRDPDSPSGPYGLTDAVQFTIGP